MYTEVVAYSIKCYGVSLCVKQFNALIKNMCNAGACVLTYWWATTVTHKLPGVYVTDGLGDRLNEAAIVKICTILGVLMTVCMRGRTKHSKNYNVVKSLLVDHEW